MGSQEILEHLRPITDVEPAISTRMTHSSNFDYLLTFRIAPSLVSSAHLLFRNWGIDALRNLANFCPRVAIVGITTYCVPLLLKM